MPIPLSCSCGARMSAPDAAAGKKVKCPKCGAALAIPAAASAFEVVDEDETPPPPPKKPPVKAARPAVAEDEDGDDRPRKKATRKAAAKAGGVPGWAWAAGGLVGVGAIAGVLFLALGNKDEPKKDTAGNATPPPGESGKTGDGRATGGNTAATTPPAGWCEARDEVGGYRVFLPGDKAVSPDFSKAGAQETRPTGCYAGIRNPAVPAEVRTFSLLPPAGVNLGGTPDELFAGLMAFNRTVGQLNEVVEKTPVTLGGKPALKVVLKKKPRPAPPKSPFDDNDPNSPIAKARAETAEWEKKELAKREVYYVTTTAERIVLVKVDAPGEPDPAILKTITDSFAFL